MHRYASVPWFSPHKTKIPNRADHPIFIQSARSNAALDPFSSSEDADELCQIVTAWPSSHTDCIRALHAKSGLSPHHRFVLRTTLCQGP